MPAKRTLCGNNTPSPQILRLAVREVKVLKEVRHPNVVQLLEAFRSNSGRVYMVGEG